MDIATILMGFAQIAIALAAFTTIASVVVKVSESTTENLLAVRLKTTLAFSMHLVVLAILPVVFYQLMPDDGAFWKHAAGSSLFTAAIVAFFGLVDQMPKVVRDPKVSWSQTIGVTAFGLASVIATIFAIIDQNPAFWYMLALALMLAGTLTMIIGLVLSFPAFDVHRKKIDD